MAECGGGLVDQPIGRVTLTEIRGEREDTNAALVCERARRVCVGAMAGVERDVGACLGKRARHGGAEPA